MTTTVYNFNLHDLSGHFYGVTLILFKGRRKKVPIFKVGILKKLPCRPLTVGIIPPLNWIPSGRHPEIPPLILIAHTYTRTKKIYVTPPHIADILRIICDTSSSAQR